MRARGFEPVLAPVIQIVATGAEPPDEKFDAIIATSANAFAFLSQKARTDLSKLKLYVAGERTGGAAVAAGFVAPEEVAADAHELAASLAARGPPSRFLYLAAPDRKSDIESVLCAMGHRVETVEVYIAEARPGVRQALLAAGLRQPDVTYVATVLAARESEQAGSVATELSFSSIR